MYQRLLALPRPLRESACVSPVSDSSSPDYPPGRLRGARRHRLWLTERGGDHPGKASATADPWAVGALAYALYGHSLRRPRVSVYAIRSR